VPNIDLVYDLERNGLKLSVQLAQTAALVLDQGEFARLGVTQVNDVTAYAAPYVRRTITVQPSADFLVQFPTTALQRTALIALFRDRFTRGVCGQVAAEEVT